MSLPRIRNAFSLGEVMVILIIISLIAAIATPRMLSSYQHMILRSAQQELSDLFFEACNSAMREQRLVEIEFDISDSAKLLKRTAGASAATLFRDPEVDFGPESQFDLDDIVVRALDHEGVAIDGPPLILDTLVFGCTADGKLMLVSEDTVLSAPIADITLIKGVATLPVYVSSFGLITTDLSRITIMYNTNSTSFAQSPAQPAATEITDNSNAAIPTVPPAFMP